MATVSELTCARSPKDWNEAHAAVKAQLYRSGSYAKSGTKSNKPGGLYCNATIAAILDLLCKAVLSQASLQRSCYSSE